MPHNPHPGHAAKAVLLMITAIWGSSFAVAHYALAAGLTPLFILMCRFLLAALFLGTVYFRRIRSNWRASSLLPCALLGAIFLLAFYFQMLGLQYSTPSNNAMIISFNVVIVPFLWWAVTKNRPPRTAFASCVVSLVGIGVISLDFSQGLALHTGDLFSLLAAVLFAGQIVFLGELTRRMDHILLVFLEFSTAALLTMALLPLSGDSFRQAANPTGMLAVLYLTAVCTCVCFLLQAWAMRRVDSARSAVIMSTEALFGALFSILLGIDALSWRIVVGGALLFASVALPEISRGRTPAGPPR